LNNNITGEYEMQLYGLIGKVLGVDPSTLNEESNAQTTPRWDSLRHIEVIFAMENAFHVRFTMPEISGLRNLGDIRRLLLSKGVRLNEPQEIRKIA
jgi:acyl carrier protein